MVIRTASSPDFRFAHIKRGQRWLPLIALLLPCFDALAADDEVRLQISRQQTQLAQLQNQVSTFDSWRIAMQSQGTQLQTRYDGLYDVQKEINTRFIGLREEQVNIAENVRQVRASQRQLQDGFSVMLAQVQTIKEEQAVSGQKLAQAESGPSNRGVVQLLNQVEALNGELNRLRGQMEVLSNDVTNAQKRQRDMYVDLDTRLRRIEQGSASKKDQDTIAALEERIRKLEQGSATAATIPQPVASTTATAPVNPPPPVSATPPPAAQAASTAAISSAAASPGSSSSLPPASLSATDQTAIQRAYDNAYNNYRLSDYLSAIRGFDSFLKSYPKHALAPNAQYWMGESYSHLRQYREAIEAERRLLGTYPESAKAPDALLIIGTAESSLGDIPAARKTFEELIARYPASESAEKAKGRLAKLK
jgi:tol-pal system protein YbgF